MTPTFSLTMAIIAASVGFPAVSDALDSLVVGQDMTNFWWRNVRQSSEHVNVTFDSIYRWDVTTNSNLGPGTLSRKGAISVRDTIPYSAPIVANVIDGNPGTSYNPDDLPDVSRTSDIVIFLGDIYRVNRIRLFPRLDSKHRQLFPQLLKVGTHNGSGFSAPAGADRENYRPYTPISTLSFTAVNPNLEPIIDRTFQSRDVMYIRLDIDSVTPWEIAEVEIYSDGTLPPGRFMSKPLRAGGRLNPIWGKVRFDGGDISELPIIVQTRTGPEANPVQYFRRTGVGDDTEEVDAGIYSVLPEEEQGPIRPNPDWSSWETATNSLIRSPDLNRHIQFRLRFPEANVILKQLIFEFTTPSVVKQLQAEIDPRAVSVADPQRFTLSLLAHMLTQKIKSQAGSTGFRQIRVRTSAATEFIEKVLVDDNEIPFTSRTESDGFTITLGRRITHDGAFVQIVFQCSLFRNATRFEVQVVDHRFVSGNRETVYQNAQDGDVDPISAGGELIVRIVVEENLLQLLENTRGYPPIITPNNDNIHDRYTLTYDLLKLTEPALVTIEIFDLAGHSCRLLYEGNDAAGHYIHFWDGLDNTGRMVSPGLYIFRITVNSNRGLETKTGQIGITY